MNQTVNKALAKASEKYSETLTLRAAMQVIPWIGGALDTLFAGKGTKISQKRIEDFLAQLNERLQEIESAKEIEPTEEFFDLMVGAFDGVLRSRSESKRKHFAVLVANQVVYAAPWEDAETALQIVSELSDAHIRVLIAALHAEPCSGSFAGLKVITVKNDFIGGGEQGHPTRLAEILPAYDSSALRLICSQLVARGLLHDEGVGRLGTKSMEYLIATETTRWLMNWIESSPENAQPSVPGDA